ncbi:mercuric transporter MerT family protein [Litoribacter populi]|uniref:mercuric transporter MerT family protein n=1 Tax=Litoribacter populi TaxID=2598460 RepID=UPI00117DEBF9|nr:mercuric transporter MerT family protein [Litoribacter populi]
MKKSITLSVSGILASITASLCCIAPVMAFLAGSGGVASNFAWVEPFRPFLSGITVAFLGLAWYNQISQSRKTTPDCSTSCDPKPSFLQGKAFLTAVTVFAFLALSFPSYSSYFIPYSGRGTR